MEKVLGPEEQVSSLQNKFYRLNSSDRCFLHENNYSLDNIMQKMYKQANI